MAHSHEILPFVPVSIFIAGLVGSPHCLSMCGPLVMNFARRKTQLLAYQLGRMISYVMIGAVVGQFGQMVLGTSRPAWLAKLSLALIAVLLFVNGYRAFTNQPLHLKLPFFLDRPMQMLSKKLWSVFRTKSLPPLVSAGLAGFLTVFLPCGHLYGFLVGAVATGHALDGAIFMFAFWLGSTPLLSFGGAWLQALLRPTLDRGHRWAGAMLVLAGCFSLAAFSLRTDTLAKPSAENVTRAPIENSAPRCH